MGVLSLNLQAQIFDNRQVIGTARITTEGLYYRFECRCQFPEPGIYRLYAFCNGKSVCLGVCVPVGSGFGISTKIPISKLGVGDITVTTEAEAKHDVLSVDPNKPFACIERLDDAVLCAGGIRIKE